MEKKDRPTAERLHALDALRAGALLLGIFLHASMTFLPGMQLWVLRDQPSELLGRVFYLAHFFRMPLFFVMSGFFARLLLQRDGTKRFIRNRLARIAAPFLVFYPLIGTAIVVVFIWGVKVGGKPALAGQTRPEMSLSTFPLTHLWFLYVLVLFYAAALLVQWVLRVADREERFRSGIVDPAMRAILATPAGSLLLAIPVGSAFLLMPGWHGWMGIEPPAFGFVPNAVALAGYGTAFTFGWLLHRQRQLFGELQRRWPIQILFALLLTAYCTWLAGAVPSVQPTPRTTAWAIYAVCYAVAIWAWILGLTGAALRYLHAERPAIRYLADSSYWLYIIHMPVLGVFQVLFYPMQWPVLVKYAAVLVCTFTVLLASYELLVRHSFVGRWLNGRRYPWQRSRTAEPVPAE